MVEVWSCSGLKVGSAKYPYVSFAPKQSLRASTVSSIPNPVVHNSPWHTVEQGRGPFLSYPIVAHSMVDQGKPDFDPYSEQDMSETSTLPGNQDAVRVALTLTVTRH